jgi:hypothetical protein
MSYNINFKVKDGAIDPESVVISGTPPTKEIKIWGHVDHMNRQVGVLIDGVTASASAAVTHA